MPTPDRREIATLALDGPRSTVCIGGRIISTDSSRATVADATGAVQMRWGALPAPVPGTWVLVRASWDGALLDATRIDVVHAPLAEFPQVRGEWVHFQDADRRRTRFLVQRAAIVRAVRAFFDQRAFLEVETPLAAPSPGLDLHLDAFAIANSDAPRFLITSPEYQMKRLLAGGLERIYQICRCFRRGELGQRHQPEFTMLEWYRTFAGSDDVMRDTEQLVAGVARAVLGTTTIGRLDLAPPWDRLPVADAFARHAGVAIDELIADPDRFFLTLVETIEPALGHERPVFLTEWPASMASLARLLPDKPDRADRFEAFVNGMELCNGFGELIDPIEQRTRLERDRAGRAARGLPVYPIDERFIDALHEGIPPSGGNALGIDRLVMVLLGVDRIEDVVAFGAERL